MTESSPVKSGQALLQPLPPDLPGCLQATLPFLCTMGLRLHLAVSKLIYILSRVHTSVVN